MGRGTYIVNLQWFYSAVDVERSFFYSGSGIRKSRHCIILQCAHCKFTVWLLQNHCITIVQAIYFASISKLAPVVFLSFSRFFVVAATGRCHTFQVLTPAAYLGSVSFLSVSRYTVSVFNWLNSAQRIVLKRLPIHSELSI